MKIIDTGLPEVKIIEPAFFSDARGFFTELFHKEKYTDLVIRIKQNWHKMQISMPI